MSSMPMTFRRQISTASYWKLTSVGDSEMQWIVDHLFELATVALLVIIAINTCDRRWNNSTIVEQLNDIIGKRDAEFRRDSAR
jgi:hypothetical protein